MKIDGATQVVGLIGWPVAHSFSPAMHNAAAAALGLNLVYVPLPVPPSAVGAAVQGLAALGFRGVNVTVPHKLAVMAYLDEVEPGARAIGAVNTVVVSRNEHEQWRLAGYNTDWSGFLSDVKAVAGHVEGRDVIVLGAGGSARAVVYALGRAGGRLYVLARRPQQAQQLIDDLQNALPQATVAAGSLADLRAVAARAHRPLIVNTTPVGMRREEAPAPDASVWPVTLPFPEDSFVYDLVYNPRETALMRQAQASGCRTVNGLGMLLRQGAQAFQLWTGTAPDLDVMRKALEEK